MTAEGDAGREEAAIALLTQIEGELMAVVLRYVRLDTIAGAHVAAHVFTSLAGKSMAAAIVIDPLHEPGRCQTLLHQLEIFVLAKGPAH